MKTARAGGWKTVQATALENCSRELVEKLSRVKLLLCDVDGVLTDATVEIGAESEQKRFHIQDGLGLRLLQRVGIKVGWVSNRPSFATANRARELRVDYLHQQDGNKVEAVERILTEGGFSWAETCYMGDDIVDLGPMRRAGVGVAVANAFSEAKAIADYVTVRSGGHGAVREVVEMILKAQNRWSELIGAYAQ